MEAIDRMERVRADHKLGVLDFLKLTGISKGSYYYYKNGLAKILSATTAKKIVAALPEVDYQWLISKSSENNIDSVAVDGQKIEDIIADKVVERLKPFINNINLHGATLVEILVKMEEIEKKITH